MKTPFPKAAWLILMLAGAQLAATARATEASDVLSPAKRQEIVDQAKKLLATRAPLPPVIDPFHSEAFNELVGAAVRAPGAATAGGETHDKTPAAAGPRSSHDLLQAIAAGLKPSGSAIVGGEPILLFGQKRVKAGGSLTITFEGSEYTLEITAIAPPNFTLRLNREEFTRTIK